MNRRGFLRGLAGVAATALSPVATFIPALAPSVEKLRAYNSPLEEIIAATLRYYGPEIAANIEANNAFIRMLKDKR